MKIDELPRRTLLQYLELTRLPLTMAERALGRTEGTWAPTLAADRLQAKVKRAAGTLLRDETLRADATLQEQALDERVRAATLESHADRLEAQADEQLRQEQRAAAEAKADVAQRAERRQQAVERRAAKKKASARTSAARRAQTIDDAETDATREALAKESAAVREQRAAVEAKAAVLELEDELEATKAARKGS